MKESIGFEEIEIIHVHGINELLFYRQKI